MSKTPPKPKKDSPDDFWDLGDDDLDLDDVAEEAEPKAEKAKEKPKEEKKKSSSARSSSKETTKPKKKKASKTEKTPPKNKKDPKPEEEIEAPTVEKTPPKDKEYQKAKVEDTKPEKSKPSLVRKKDGWTREKKEQLPLSIIEKISLVALIACLIGAASWGLSTFVSDAPQGDLITFDENYPATGDNVTIESLETWWRAPIRTGDNADAGVVLSSNLIPCARIKISNASATTLRLTFRDGEKELIGDTINLMIENGKFLLSDSDEITIHSTEGFDNASRINAYANGDINPWSLAVFEENSKNEKPLVKARISADEKLN